MAWVQARNGSYRVLFRYAGKPHSLWLGEVKPKEAQAVADKVEYWLMRLKQGLVRLPPGCDVATFVRHDGRPPEAAAHADAAAGVLTLAGLRDAYLRAQERKLEATTLAGIRLHFDHLARLLGGGRVVGELTRADLQAYADRRSGEWIDPNVFLRRRREKAAAAPPKRRYTRKAPPAPEPADKPRRHPSAATIRKEVVSLRTAWNWARRHLALKGEFPGSGLDYAKTVEALPFMTWEEAERRVRAGGDPDAVWDSVYLRPAEVAELLAWAKGRPVRPWVYPMVCFAAHTGARRSEVVRAVPADLDLAGGVVTIREKKRDKRRLTTRQVPLSPFLREVLASWVKDRADGKTLFCKDDGSPITPREAHNYLQRALRVSKWNVLRGWHVFRHSLVSALASKGVDQRVIDDMVGHSTDEQRRRYRHLYPDVRQQAIAAVFS